MQHPSLADAVAAFRVSDPDSPGRCARYVSRALWRLFAGAVDRRFYGGALSAALGLADRASLKDIRLSDGSTVAAAVADVPLHGRWLTTLVLGSAQYARDPHATSCEDAAARARAMVALHEALLGPLASCADCDRAAVRCHDAVQPGEVDDLRALAKLDLSSVADLERWHVWPHQPGPAYVERSHEELLARLLASRG